MSIVGSQTVVGKVVTSWNGSIPFRVHFTRPGKSSDNFTVLESYFIRVWKGGPDPAFSLLFHENPASRTFSSLSRISFCLSQKYIKKTNFCKG